MSHFTVLLIFAASLIRASAFAQTTIDDCKARLIGKPLYLRGRWTENKLQFTSVGDLVGDSKIRSWTLSGVQIESAKIGSGGIAFEGKRVGVELIKDMPRRIALKQKITIMIASPTGGDYTQALDKIFAVEIADMIPSMPSFWQDYAVSHLSPNSLGQSASHSPSPATSTPPPPHPGGDIKAPVPIKVPDPIFSDVARNEKYSGTTLVSIEVDETGKPNHLNIVRPCGLGLDEQAIYTVSQYLFKPALKAGNPIRSSIDVEVAFNIF